MTPVCLWPLACDLKRRGEYMKYLLLMMMLILAGCGKKDGRTLSVENPTALDSLGESSVSDTVEDPVVPDDSQTDLPDLEEDPETEEPNPPTLPIATNKEFQSNGCFRGKWRGEDSVSYLRAEVKFLESGIGHFKLEMFEDEGCQNSTGKQNIHVRYDVVKTDSGFTVIRMEEFAQTDGILWLTLRSSETGLYVNWNADWELAGPHLENPSSELIQQFANCYETCGIEFSATR